MSDARRAVVAALVSLGVAGLAHAQAAKPAPAPSGKPATAPMAPPPPGEAVLDTAMGEIVIRLLPDVAPGHVRLFQTTAKAGKFDGTTFHRIIAGGIIQGGDPNTKDPNRASTYGQGGLGLLKAEFSDRPFVRGTVAAARQPGNKDSGGTQFFICLRDQPTLAGQYTIFAEVVSGMDVADAISMAPADGDKPKERILVRKVTLRDAPPPP